MHYRARFGPQAFVVDQLAGDSLYGPWQQIHAAASRSFPRIVDPFEKVGRLSWCLPSWLPLRHDRFGVVSLLIASAAPAPSATTPASFLRFPTNHRNQTLRRRHDWIARLPDLRWFICAKSAAPIVRELIDTPRFPRISLGRSSPHPHFPASFSSRYLRASCR